MPITSRIRCEVKVETHPKTKSEPAEFTWVTSVSCSSSEPGVILAVLERFELRVHKEKARCWFRPNADDETQKEIEVEWVEGKGPCITYVDASDYDPREGGSPRSVTQSIRDFMVNGI